MWSSAKSAEVVFCEQCPSRGLSPRTDWLTTTQNGSNAFGEVNCGLPCRSVLADPPMHVLRSHDFDGDPLLKLMLILKIIVESQLEVDLLRVTDNNETRSRAHYPTEFSVLSWIILLIISIPLHRAIILLTIPSELRPPDWPLVRAPPYSHALTLSRVFNPISS